VNLVSRGDSLRILAGQGDSGVARKSVPSSESCSRMFVYSKEGTESNLVDSLAECSEAAGLRSDCGVITSECSSSRKVDVLLIADNLCEYMHAEVSASLGVLSSS
jgi:hypothetical protein